MVESQGKVREFWEGYWAVTLLFLLMVFSNKHSTTVFGGTGIELTFILIHMVYIYILEVYTGSAPNKYFKILVKPTGDQFSIFQINI